MAATMLRRDMAISSRMGLGAWIADQYNPGGGAGQGIFGAIFQVKFFLSRPRYRHSRVSGSPAAVRQVAGLFSTVRDSRLRGKDGRGVE